MRIGVISEGHADRAVISNIVVGVTELDRSSIIALRPASLTDETDKASKELMFSTSSLVIEECKSRKLIDMFLQLDGNDFVIIHLDTAEAADFGVLHPRKDENYCSNLRKMVVQKISEWTGKVVFESILCAIAVEEMEAWLLTLFEKRDSSMSAKPKEKLQYILGKRGLDSTSNEANFDSLSKPFKKKKTVLNDDILARNRSLSDFVDEIKLKVVPRISG